MGNFTSTPQERPRRFINVDNDFDAYSRYIRSSRIDRPVCLNEDDNGAQHEQKGVECCNISTPDTTLILTDVRTVKDVKNKLMSRCDAPSVVNIDEGIIYDDDEDIGRIQKPIQIMFGNKERYVNSPDDLTNTDTDVFYMEDENLAQMDCLHYASAAALVGYLKSELCDKQATEIRCPLPSCQKLWSMKNVREKADLTQDEIIFFQAVFDKNHIKQTAMVKCPRCDTFCSRKDEDNTILRCSYCKRSSDKTDFCFKCGSEYDSGHNCPNLMELQNILDHAKLKTIGKNINVPSVRLCPNPSCEATIEHKSDCKQMKCSRCGTDFCFVCLTLTEKGRLKCSSYFEKCETHPVQKVNI